MLAGSRLGGRGGNLKDGGAEVLYFRPCGTDPRHISRPAQED